MRISTIAAIAVLASPGISRAADDGPWCYRDFGGPQYTNCSFPSARQCLAVAGTVGGICERNRQPLAVAPRTKAKAQRS